MQSGSRTVDTGVENQVGLGEQGHTQFGGGDGSRNG